MSKFKSGPNKFNKLTPAEKKWIKETYSDKSVLFKDRMSAIGEKFNIKSRTVEYWISWLGYKHEKQESPQYLEATKKKHDKRKNIFFITWAQNDTPVHKSFLKNMEAYAKYLNADIHVILGRYKNPTSVFPDQPYDVWAPEVLPYKDANRHDLNRNISILSDIKVQPTAVLPLSGLEGVSRLSSCVIGSPRVQLKVVAALEGYRPKVMMTTGAVTKKNYTDSKSGKKGEFHHTYGFVVVELKGTETFFLRQVTATDNGDFCDLVNKISDGKVSKVDTIEAAVLGDIHWGQTCQEVHKAQRKWLDRLKPKSTVVHDIFDGYSINHHEEDDPIKQFFKIKDNKDLVQSEIDALLDWVESMKKYNLVIPSANHNDFIDRWIKRVDWKKHLRNAQAYNQYSNILLSGNAPDGIIAYLIKERFGKAVKVLGRNENFSVAGWELSNHGDLGVNGSRGSLSAYKKLNIKMVNGHTHIPAREEGVLYVGTSTRLRVGYNMGASSWLNADVIIHKDKKAQHILYFGGEFTTLKV